jgi:hypothetical protein
MTPSTQGEQMLERDLMPHEARQVQAHKMIFLAESEGPARAKTALRL